MRSPSTLAGIGIAAASLLPLLGNSGDRVRSLIFLPGTQPGTTDTIVASASSCAGCHASGNGRTVPVHDGWAGSMMAHSARDPVFHAALAVTNKYAADAGDNTGEYCIRCHSPSGWLAGRSEDVTGRSLRGTDLDGVQCDYCHRLVDPLNPDSTTPPTVYPVPGYGNGMHLVQASSEVRRGPRDGAAASHPAMADPFQESGSLCGICHDVSNPFQTQGSERIDAPPHAYAPLERTYSEWLMSAFPSEGPAGSCQGCHMPRVAGHAASIPAAPARDDVRSHDFTGGNTFVPLILPEFWPGLDTARLRDASDRAAATLRRAAMLSGSALRVGDSVRLNVRVTNLTGHKLPTGYPEGRRIWLAVRAVDAGGGTVFASGTYDTAAGALSHDPALRTYEAVHGLTDSTASVHGLAAGESFHFSLNDTVLFDNRIPPRGFTNAGFASRLASPVGSAYDDGEHWDDAAYDLPSSAVAVEVGLWYQGLTREYAEFLRDENDGNVFDWNGWGARLWDAWERNGRSAPVLMDSLSLSVADSVTAVGPGPPSPGGFRLDPVYPNPFNGTASVRFVLPVAGDATLDVADASGRVVAVLADGPLPAGERTLSFSAPTLASGMYVVRLRAGASAISRKILIIR